MKKSIFIILSFLLIHLHFLNAQENVASMKNGRIGITYASFGENDVIRFDELDGAASYNGDYFHTLGITYVYPLNEWLEAETGIEYARYTIIIQPNLPPDMAISLRKENFALINIPLTLRAKFLKYFFVNGGLIVDIDGSKNSPIDNQTGIGAILGIAIEYNFDLGISVFVNPYAKAHSLIPFQTEKYHQRIMENGIRIGVTFDLRKMK